MTTRFLPAYSDVSAAYQSATQAVEYKGSTEWMSAFDEAMRSFGYVQEVGPCTCEFDPELGHLPECGWYAQ